MTAPFSVIAMPLADKTVPLTEDKTSRAVGACGAVVEVVVIDAVVAMVAPPAVVD
jgi:hypothetical protein